MPDIKHSIQIEATPQLVFPLVASAKGFARWWAVDVTEDSANEHVELGFFNRATVYGLHPVQIAARARLIGSANLEKNGTARACSSI